MERAQQVRAEPPAVLAQATHRCESVLPRSSYENPRSILQISDNSRNVKRFFHFFSEPREVR